MKLARLSYSLLLAAALHGALAPECWLCRQRITPSTPITRVTLDRAVYDGAAGSLADLRVVRDGSEVPYLLSIADATRQTDVTTVRVVNKETRAGTLFVTLEFDAGQVKREPHNQLQLAVTRDDSRSQLTIEASDDGRQWATVRQSAYIFRYRADDGQMVEHTYHPALPGLAPPLSPSRHRRVARRLDVHWRHRAFRSLCRSATFRDLDKRQSARQHP